MFCLQYFFGNSGFYEDAIGYLEQQLGTLERVNSSTAQLDRARALGHLADCYDALNDFEEGNLRFYRQMIASRSCRYISKIKSILMHTFYLV